MPLDQTIRGEPMYDDDALAAPVPADHSGARWMVAVGVCLLMLGIACSF